MKKTKNPQTGEKMVILSYMNRATGNIYLASSAAQIMEQIVLDGFELRNQLMDAKTIAEFNQ